jgi:glycosyltransferase involved in cell wall biosynthesis
MPIPKVSAVITTKNEQAVIERLLESLKNQTYNNIEIIVVDNNSSDKTKLISKKYTRKVFNKGPERSVQRNYGASKAAGKYLLFLDADMELGKNVIRDAVNALDKDKKVGQVVIPERSVANNFWESIKAYERSFYLKEGDTSIEAARFFLKKVFKKVGGYDKKITGPEDWDLPENVTKLGFKTARIKSKILHYERIKSPLDLARKKFYYGLKSSVYLSKNKIPAIGPKTIYLLRPVFYKNWKILISNPLKTLALFWMLTLEQFGGGLGYFLGKVKKF